MSDPTRSTIHLRSIVLATAVAATVSFVAGERIGVRIGEAHAIASVPALALARAAVPGDDGLAGAQPPAADEPGGIGSDCNTQVR
jgi:hypothetical protein